MTSELYFATGLILAGFVLLSFGGEYLVRGSATLALLLGISPLVVGLTVVALGTSAPELVVCIQAALAGRGAIGAGNVVGSNILNIGLILGLTVIIAPMRVQSRVLRADMPILILMTCIGIAMLWNAYLSRLEGVILFGLLVGYLWFTIWSTRERHGGRQGEIAMKRQVGSIWKYIALIAAGFVGLIFGADFLVRGAIPVARFFGMSEAAIGLTIVATGTSMPEIATSVAAAARKQSDIALGNIIGSNIFNLLAILGIASIIHPMSAEGLLPTDLLTMLAFTVILVPFARTGFHFARWEGAVLLLGYCTYIYFLWPKGAS
jgi:cation:H+ antiporter